MSYNIFNTSDKQEPFIVVNDGEFDTSRSLTMIGKNSVNFGTALNENFLHLLENFASYNSPTNPVIGQLWYDTTEKRLKVYDGINFSSAAGTVITTGVNAAPVLTKGDFWIDSYTQQLFFNDGVSTVLAGPIYTKKQLTSGFEIATLYDSDGTERVVALLKVAGETLGVFSNTSFYPRFDTPIAGYVGKVEIGFSVVPNKNIRFNVPTMTTLGLSINLGALTDQQVVSTIIDKVYPPAEFVDSTVCRVYCIDTTETRKYVLFLGVWTFDSIVV